MPTVDRNPRQHIRLNLLYSALGLPALSLLVAWAIELLAETVFLR